MFHKIILSLFAILPSVAMAADLPFTDVSPKAPYYADLKHMYDAGVIGDASDNLFRPEGLLGRDEFVGIVVGVSCRKCIYPTPADIIRYTLDPFADIFKKNRYFYCISYAKEKEIVRGYTLDSTGKTQCQDGKSFSEVPFCPTNNITRIEAAAVLLRQAGIWNEASNNGTFEKKMDLPDVDPYWYGYAQKAIESGLISQNGDKKVFPNEYIARKEFVTMASKIFSINMCQVKAKTDTSADFGSAIKIFDKTERSCLESARVTAFPDPKESVYDFGGYATGIFNPPLRYDWTFSNTRTGEQKSATGGCLDDFSLESTGSWVVKLLVVDSNGRSSTSYQQVSVGSDGLMTQIGNTRDPLKTAATTLYGTVGVPMPFFSTTSGWDGHYSYRWDFGDGGISSNKDPTHTYAKEGTYAVPLVVHDTSGNVAYAQLTVILSPNLDRDRDGIRDYDTSGNILDLCPNVYGPASNKGCPLVNEYGAWDSSTANSGLSDINNLCLENKIKTSGMIEGNVACTSCPCAYSSDFRAKVRSCDIIFPSITSPDKKTLYSRGSIFAVP